MRTLIDREHKNARNQVMLIDDAILITGSFNFSADAESNAESMLVIRDIPGVVDSYVQNFDQHEAHAVAYVPPPNNAAGAMPPTAPKAKPPVAARP